MKILLSFTLSLFLFIGNAQTTCDTVVNKILMVGDSWSNFPVGFGSFENNLDRFGFTNIGMFSNTSNLSVNGAETHDFLTPSGKTAIQNALTANPTIEIVNLSIGGNDILNNWNNSMDSISTDSLLDATLKRVDSIIMNIETMKPGIKVYVSGYDFANFGEVIQTFGFPTFHPFYNRWDGMGKPTFVEMNSLLSRASKKFEVLVNTYFHAYYKSPIGLMQYLYGQSTALGVAPNGTYAAGTVPFPGGRLDYPTPKIRMNDYTAFIDCFHLDAEGYDMLYKYYFEEYYLGFLRGDVDFTITSQGNGKDGGVSSTGNITSRRITVGNNTATGINKGIISFNTSTIATTPLHRGDIFLHRENQTGTLPSFNKVILELKQGNLGTSVNIDLNDYSSLADAKDTACVYGSLKENGFWLRIRIPNSMLSQINTSGITQFRVSMIDTTDGNLFYFSTGDSLKKPFIDLEYYNPTSITKNTKKALPVLYPNPSNSGMIKATNLSGFDGEIKAIDLTGRSIPLTYTNQGIDVSNLTAGSYFILFSDKKEQFALKFVKL